MENMENNDGQAQGAMSDKLMAMFANYEKSHDSGSKPTRGNILAKYFTPRNRTEIFRILPPMGGRDYIETAYFHVVKANTPTGKKFKKIYCPAHNERVPKKDAQGNVIKDKGGNPVLVPPYCPLCAKYKTELSKQDNSIRSIMKEQKLKVEDLTPDQKKIFDNNKEIWKTASQWEAKKFYIVRGIDKGAEKDGVKFWRFKHNFRQQGVQDKLVPVLGSYIQQYESDFTDAEKGTDLMITVVDAKMPNGNPYKDVTSITTRPPSKLHSDNILEKQWLSDPITWREVFKPAKAPHLESSEYMERLTRGVDPYWDDTDSNNKRWVFPDPNDAELQVRANTRDLDLDADNAASRMETASDVVVNYDNPVNINNVKKEDVGTFKDDAVEMGTEMSTPAETQPSVETQPVVEEQKVDVSVQPPVDDYEDLPF